MTPAAAPRLLVVLGPTGTGKSELAVRLAESLDGEIVGCDALQVYRGLDAATAKPAAELRARVPHHLLDCVDPRIDFTMADYVRAAEAQVAAIAGRGRVPLVVGGSGMYLRGLLRGVIEAPPRDERLRRRLAAVRDRGGAERLRRWLERVDPDSARRIPRGDVQRSVRALELALAGGGTWSERLAAGGTWSRAEERYSTLKLGLDTDPAALARRLDARVERFFERGLVEEARALLRAGVPRTANAFKAIGYREVLRAIDEGRAPDAARDEVRRNTRRYAKRQRTWFRTESGTVWLDAARPIDELTRGAIELWRRA